MPQIRPAIAKKMFTSPIILYKMSEPDAYGDRTSTESVNLMGYLYDDAVVVDNMYGTQESSSHQVYLAYDDIQKASPEDRVDYVDEADMKGLRVIKKSVFRGPKSKVGIGILYLP